MSDMTCRLRKCLELYDPNPKYLQEQIGDAIDEIDSATAERDALQAVLHRHGFVRCDIPACNCGSWHPRYGLPERMQELKDDLADAGHELCNANGHLVRNALRALIGERDKAVKSLRHYGYTDCGGELWKPPLGKNPLPQIDRLRAALKELIRAYVRLLESGRDRIRDLGGTCDPVDVLERADPELRKAREALAELWCVHVLGPDDVIAAPSEVEARRAVTHLEKFSRKLAPRAAAEGLVGFQAAPWPHSAQAHAKDVVRFYTVTGLPPLAALPPENAGAAGEERSQS